MSVRPTLELRNFLLLPNDIRALAFVANAAGDDGVGLDFGSCSMELECLDILTTCRNVHHLRWEDKNTIIASHVRLHFMKETCSRLLLLFCLWWNSSDAKLSCNLHVADRAGL